MGRPKEERYWNEVTKQADGTWKCNRCESKFSGRISVTRIKAHVDRIPGKGISPCSASLQHNHPQPLPQQTANPMEGDGEDHDHEMVDAISGGLTQHPVNVISEPTNYLLPEDGLPHT
ncbi:hypothetical protein S245_014505 [Arachis hypogaea]